MEERNLGFDAKVEKNCYEKWVPVYLSKKKQGTTVGVISLSQREDVSFGLILEAIFLLI